MLNKNFKFLLVVICSLSVSIAGFWLISKTFAVYLGPSGSPPDSSGIFKIIAPGSLWLTSSTLKIGDSGVTFAGTRFVISDYSYSPTTYGFKIFGENLTGRQNILAVNDNGGITVGAADNGMGNGAIADPITMDGNPLPRSGECDTSGHNCPLMYIAGKLLSEKIGAYSISASGTITSGGGFIGNLIGGVSAGGVSSGVFGSLVGGGNYYFPSSVGIRSSSALPEFQLDLDGDATNSGIISRGTLLSGDTLSTSGAGTRLIWYPRKSAFRAGTVSDNQWDNANIGNYSTALGSDNTASGHFSTALGHNNIASAQDSNAFGNTNTASGAMGSTAIGVNNIASGFMGSIALGANNTAAGDYSSVAIGLSVLANRRNSIIIGGGCITDSGSTVTCSMSNNATGTLAVGFNSNIPTFVVTRSAGLNTTGNVGIGTSVPAYKLSVAGDVNITGTYRVNGVPFAAGVTGSGVPNALVKWDATGLNLTTSSIKEYNGLISSNIKFSQSSDYAISGGDGKSGMTYGYNLTIRGGNGFGTGDRGGDLFLAGGAAIAATPGDIIMQSSTNPGNVGVGKEPAYKLDVAGDINVTGAYRVNGTAIGISGSGYNGAIPKWTGTSSLSTSQMTDTGTAISMSGQLFVTGISTLNNNVGIGIAPTSDKLRVYGNVKIGTPALNGCVRNAMDIVIAGDCPSPSDRILKKNITYLDNVLEKVASLQPATFEWRAENYPETGFGPEINYGLIAQDVEKIFPELVVTDVKGLKSIKYYNLPMLTLEAIKEQQKIITGLENRINLLESKIK